MTERPSALLWALVIFDSEGEFEAVLDVGSKREMDDAALDPALHAFQPEVALVQSSARQNAPSANLNSPSAGHVREGEVA